MLKTCLKYDLRAIRKLFGLMLLISLCAGLFGGLLLRLFMSVPEPSGLLAFILLLFFMIGIFSCFFGLMGAFMVGYYCIFVEFYRNFFTDQGYLTFTLPVRRSTLYLSKVITGTLAQLTILLSTTLGFFFIFLFAVPGQFTSFLSDLSAYFSKNGAWPLLWVIPILAVAIAVLLLANGMAYLCIVLAGTRVRKLKLLAAVGIYYGMQNVGWVALFLAGIPFIAAFISITEAVVEIGGVPMWWMSSALILIIAMLIGCMASIFHYIAVGQLERKLNLT